MTLREFKKTLKNFGINLPPHLVYEQRKEGIRVFSKMLMELKLKGFRGIVVYSTKPTHSFALSLGIYASKNKIEVEDPKKALSNEKMKTKNKDGYYIISYKNIPITLAKVKNNTIYPLTPPEISRSFSKS